MNPVDVSVFKTINGWPEETAQFWIFLTHATKRPEGILLILFFVVGQLIYKKTRLATLIALISWPLANLLTDILKKGLRWPRPSWPEILANQPEFHVRVEPLTSFGTASAHSANMMCVATVLMFFDRRVASFWILVAILTGISRIYVGVHWPSQVLFGWLCGAVVGIITSLATKLVIRRFRQESVANPKAQKDQYCPETTSGDLQS